MVLYVEEREPFVGVGQNDKESVHEFHNLGKVKHVCPEEERAVWFSVFREANDVVEIRRGGEDGEGATDGHDEGEGEETNVMDGCD